MKTQGINLVSAGLTNTGLQQGTKTTKATKATFDSFMGDHASQVKPADDAVAPASSESVQQNRAGQPEKAGQEIVSGRPVKEKEIPAAENAVQAPEDIDMTGVREQVAALLAQIFGMTEEEMTDILEQNGLDPLSLLFQVKEDGTMSLVNQEALQQIVMDVHGIEDKSAFLTNGELTGELEELANSVQDLEAELLGVEPETLTQADQALVQKLTEHLAAGTGSVNAAEVQLGAVPVENVGALRPDIQAAGDTQAEVPGEEPQVIVEDYRDAGDTGSQMQSSTGESDSGEKNSAEAQVDSETASVAPQQTETQPASDRSEPLHLFAERLTQAVGEGADEAVQTRGTGMRNIVDQIVRQVRIRVLPETTSMELQLHPETLGRVQLRVSTVGGVATASMLVENQVAREALESQMFTLRQSFEEQGLKVDAVEVAVSDFGLKQDQEQAQTQNGQQDPGNRRNAEQGADTGRAEETPEDAVQTAEERRDVNSVVDYTA